MFADFVFRKFLGDYTQLVAKAKAIKEEAEQAKTKRPVSIEMMKYLHWKFSQLLGKQESPHDPGASFFLDPFGVAMVSKQMLTWCATGANSHTKLRMLALGPDLYVYGKRIAINYNQQESPNAEQPTQGNSVAVTPETVLQVPNMKSSLDSSTLSTQRTEIDQQSDDAKPVATEKPAAGGWLSTFTNMLTPSRQIHTKDTDENNNKQHKDEDEEAGHAGREYHEYQEDKVEADKGAEENVGSGSEKPRGDETSTVEMADEVGGKSDTNSCQILIPDKPDWLHSWQERVDVVMNGLRATNTNSVRVSKDQGRKRRPPRDEVDLREVRRAKKTNRL